MKIKVPYRNRAASAPPPYRAPSAPTPGEVATSTGSPEPQLEPSQPVTGAPAPAPPVLGQVLPMYFVGDESHSMSGAPMTALNQGLLELRDEVVMHPLIGKKVRFAIVTFADTAQTRLELSELSEEVILPTLSPRGRGTSYASAFSALRDAIPADIALLKSDGYQVHRPSVFFLSDGLPTENEQKWQTALAQLKDPDFAQRPNVLSFGVGDADAAVIQQVASAPRFAFMMRDGVSTAGAISEFAASMLNSMVSSAQRLDRGEQTIEFEKPDGFVSLDAPLV